jgi:Double zinc ribbon
MKSLTTILFMGCLLFASPAIFAGQSHAGKWTMTSMTLNVTVESWGANCGPKPRSYSSKSARPVEIASRGKHLVFSKGGIRTDRCGSPNPRVRTVNEKSSDGNWKRTCQTARNDPKYEYGDYSLVAIGNERLEYTAVSKFDWTLKGDHCVARSKERRVYVRGSEEKAAKKSKGKTKTEEKKETEVTVQPGCEETGPAKRISIFPRNPVLGPGEQVCFKANAVDANNCRFDASVNWSVSQDGQPVRGLISRNGCFYAGETAADAEGSYSVTARGEGKVDSVELQVVFPDLTDLLAARLRPLEDATEEQPPAPSAVQPSTAHSVAPVATPTTQEPTQQSTVPSPPDTPTTDTTPVSPKDDGLPTWLLIVGVLVVLLGAGLAVFLFIRRSAQLRIDEDDEFDDWPDDPRSSSSPAQPSNKTAFDQELFCPQCGKSLPAGSRFCPIDGAKIEAENIGKSGSSNTNPEAQGMICPKCSRGYDAEARFCPHDSEKLVTYSAWKTKNRSGKMGN